MNDTARKRGATCEKSLATRTETQALARKTGIYISPDRALLPTFIVDFNTAEDDQSRKNVFRQRRPPTTLPRLRKLGSNEDRRQYLE